MQMNAFTDELVVAVCWTYGCGFIQIAMKNPFT